MNTKVNIQTYKPGQIKININGFNVVKSAVQLLDDPRLVYISYSPSTIISAHGMLSRMLSNLYQIIIINLQ